MKSSILSTLLLILCSTFANGQQTDKDISNQLLGNDFQKRFLFHCETEDTVNQLIVLKEWEKVEPNNPELFISYFNYHYSKSRQSGLRIMNEAPDDESLVISDSTGNVVSYLGNEVVFYDEEFKKGIERIDEGIKRFPARLDMWFGKIYAFGDKKDWVSFTKTIKEVIRQSSKVNNEWKWSEGSQLDGGKESFLQSIHTYQLQLYNSGEEQGLLNMREIANEVLKHYPEDIPSLSNLAITYMILREFELALPHLLKAEKLDPKDDIVLSNIARVYALMEDKAMAIAYYEKVVALGNEQMVTFAKQQIEALSK